MAVITLFQFGIELLKGKMESPKIHFGGWVYEGLSWYSKTLLTNKWDLRGGGVTQMSKILHKLM